MNVVEVPKGAEELLADGELELVLGSGKWLHNTAGRAVFRENDMRREARRLLRLIVSGHYGTGWLTDMRFRCALRNERRRWSHRNLDEGVQRQLQTLVRRRETTTLSF